MGKGNDSVLRGSRVGHSGFSNESARYVEAADRADHAYFCPRGHDFKVTFAAEADVPDLWECPQCGSVASTTPDGEAPQNLASPPTTGKTHYQQLLGRRTEAELEALLARALKNYRKTGRAFTVGQD